MTTLKLFVPSALESLNFSGATDCITTSNAGEGTGGEGDKGDNHKRVLSLVKTPVR